MPQLTDTMCTVECPRCGYPVEMRFGDFIPSHTRDNGTRMCGAGTDDGSTKRRVLATMRPAVISISELLAAHRKK